MFSPGASPPLVSSIVSLSKKTFQRCPSSKRLLLDADSFRAHCDDLRGLLLALTAEDVGLDKSPFMNAGRKSLADSPSLPSSQPPP